MGYTINVKTPSVDEDNLHKMEVEAHTKISELKELMVRNLEEYKKIESLSEIKLFRPETPEGKLGFHHHVY